MLIPIKHENMAARRWPVITFALIALNVVIFVITNGMMQDQAPKLAETRAHILMLAAAHPQVTIPEAEQKLVDDFKKRKPELWTELQHPNREVADAWDAHMRMLEEPEQFQAEMDSLCKQYEEMNKDSIVTQYAYIPAHPTPMSYITANFLHGGWLHLIGNMWFLWLAGFVLEDTWGRWIYPLFYLVAGAAALQFHTWTNPTSTVPLVGASGAVAALMGAFLVRFPKMRIEMYWRPFLFKGYRFKAPAYTLLPLWLLMEVFYGSLFGSGSGVAHWAHVGGFVFGAVAATGLRFSGLEHLANQAIEEKLGVAIDPAITEATELMDQGQLDPAIGTLSSHVAANPGSVEGYALLQQIYWRQQDMPKYHDVTAKLCELHLRAREYDPAWQNYEDFLNTGGKNMPAALWLDLCRAAEEQQAYDRALGEYDKLIQTYPKEKQSLMAQIAAGKVCLQRLNRPQDALKYFEAAKASQIPHLDWEMNIEAGIRDAKKVLTGAVAAK